MAKKKGPPRIFGRIAFVNLISQLDSEAEYDNFGTPHRGWT